MAANNVFTRMHLIGNCEISIGDAHIADVQAKNYVVVLEDAQPTIMDVPLNAQVKLCIDNPVES